VLQGQQTAQVLEEAGISDTGITHHHKLTLKKKCPPLTTDKKTNKTFFNKDLSIF